MNMPEITTRLTTQRKVILDELSKVKTHPTASEVYDMVRQKLPRISLGTVYRNLELMSANGLILKIEAAGTQKRFDATTRPHYHIRCSCCDRVDDIDMPVSTDLVDIATTRTSYQVLGHRVEFTGFCPDCRGKNKSSETH